ncbi:DUF2058 domain-containing protein [Catenovulum maritimum]|uniref:Nucleoprotein/polynucleotide-associated enzyme n=1 Tax=Catenovulum maritimum TaxID=1513271 RepID=A0A0J8JPK8_9ALTE|nr:DUF2058 domain-containing protein [Catenovulum maritimum]KMT66581.1 hypothetical protein XM47_03350 [Catenovulum maritimum]
MSSLKDQFLKAGLVNKKQANKAKKSSKKSRTLKKEVQAAAEAKKSELLAKDQQANDALNQQAKEKAIAAQIKQLIQSHTIAPAGEIEYNFEFQSKVKTIRVSQQQKNQLVNGQVAIAAVNDTCSIIPTAIAEKINQRNEGYIVLLNTLQETEEDDPYADYQIPDDLMW